VCLGIEAPSFVCTTVKYVAGQMEKEVLGREKAVCGLNIQKWQQRERERVGRERKKTDLTL